jgi:hypothetical protein
MLDLHQLNLTKGDFMNWYRALFLVFLSSILSLSCSTTEQKNDPPVSLLSSSGQIFTTGLIVPKDFKPTNVKSARDGLRGDLPAEFDARVKGYKSPENQGSCGSCWAFSMSATVQDSYKYQTGKDFDTSEQHILSCTKPGEYSCNGGFFDYGRHMTPFGGVTGASWPYSATDEACRSGLNHQLKIKSWSYTPGGDNPSVDEIKAAIYRYGIASVGVAADQAFSNYSGGIFQDSGSRDLNHAVNVVGWSDSGQYWILKNSWGASWGDGTGHMKIKWGANGVGAWANYVVFDDQPGPGPGPDPDPEPDCKPKPVASTGYGASVWVRAGQTIRMGMKARTGTTYYWTASPAFDNNARPEVSMIDFRPAITKTLTLNATNQCGTASAKTTVNVSRNFKAVKEKVVAAEKKG